MRILVIDDEESMRHMLGVLLSKEGYDVTRAESAESGLKALKKEGFDFILCDIRMPGMGGTGFLSALAELGQEHTVIMMSAFGIIDTALECIKLGAYDYISKPFKSDEILLTIRKAEERERLKRENRRLKSESQRGVENIITSDAAVLALLEMVKKVSDYDTTVLVTGESGTGKELVARALHYNGKRAENSFVAVNCGAIPLNLIESELFGHVKGAFTDAARDRVGLFEEAHGGTLFLDEIGDLPLDMQVKLLRVLEDREVRRVGATKSHKVDVRVVTATARDLAAAVREGRFREDLFYRLNVISLAIPPLRERTGDVALLAEHFAHGFSQKFSKPYGGISSGAMETLMAYQWPGNVRELENVMERAVILQGGQVIEVADLPFAHGAGVQSKGLPARSGLSIKKESEILERELISEALKQTGGNKTRASKLLEISHNALLYKIKNYKL